MMADNAGVYDQNVARIVAAVLAPRFILQGGGFQLLYKIEFTDGRTQYVFILP